MYIVLYNEPWQKTFKKFYNVVLIWIEEKTTLVIFREGLKNTFFYPHLVDIGSWPMWIRERGGGLQTWIIISLYNIIVKCWNGDEGWGRVSKCHGLMVVRPHTIFLTLRKILRFVWSNLKIMHLNRFWSLFFMIHTYYEIFGVIFALVSCAKL